MKKSILLLICVLAWSLNIDITSLESQLKKHPGDIQNRLVVASYYIEHGDYLKAGKYLNEVLKKDPKNKYAVKLKQKIKDVYEFSEIMKKYKDINKALNNLYEKQKYKKMLSFYNTLKNLSKTASVNENNKLNTARAAMWEGKYGLSLNILSSLKNRQTLDYYEIKAYDLYYKGDYKNAEKYFQILFQTTDKPEYAQKLLEIYFNLGKMDAAQKLLLSLKRTHPEIAKKYENKIIQIKQQKINSLKKQYEKNPTFSNMQQLAYALFETSHQNAISLVKNYIKQKPNDSNAKIFLAQLLSWNGNNKEALNYLKEFQNSNDTKAKLLFGKILAWQGNYDKATLFLSDVYEHGSPAQKYEAKKMLGFIAMWQNQNSKAKKIFVSLLKQNPKDEDVTEALMVLNRNIKPLIAKYEKLLRKNPGNEEYILKLADYNYMLDNYSKAAYYYEQYLKKHPEKIEIYKTLGDIYLKLKNYYKGFGDLEYYAGYTHTKQAYLDLAYRYYWNGFNKEALNVLDNLLKTYPDYQDALILKAKILKVNPRFVDSSTSATIDGYYAKRGEKILALGDRAYFAGLYKSAADYYKEYLFLKPDDYDVREKYAYSLESSKEYAKAAGEFFLLMWYKKTPLIEYHYAYNLQKSGKPQQAEKIYRQLLKNTPKPLPEFLKTFIEKWKKAWESMDFNKYASFYGKSISQNLYWKLKKQSIFKRSSFISIEIYSPVLIGKNGDVYTVRFFQVYASKIKKDKGYKTLEIKCGGGKCKIIKEIWKPGTYTPYNPENSLEKYIKDNLNEINSTKKTEIKLTENTITPPQNIIHKKQTDKKVKKQDIVLASGLKLEPESKKTALDYLYLKKEKATVKNTIQSDLKESFNKKFGWEIYGFLNYFKDNQNTKMLTRYLTVSHYIKGYCPFVFYKNYSLSEKSNKKGFLYGLGIKKNRFLFDFFIDKSGKNTVGWDTEYKLYSLKGITLRLNRHNMVYSRKTVCSSNHTKIKAEITGYRLIQNPRELWWSLAYEKVDDGNRIFTPQFEYDIKTFSLKKTPLILYVSGWYQFNSKHTECYYSPNKTDTNIIGLKFFKNLKHIKLKLKTGIGYSFFDNTYVYNYGIWIYSKNIKNFQFKAGCQLSNTSGINTPSNYKSEECEITARKKW
jgi:tetratricopeptide (TPR) repeat protein